MTDAQKKVLIDKLGAKSNKGFDARYSEDNRKWFVGKIIESLLAQRVPDADVEAKTNDIIKASGLALNARIRTGFTPAATLVNKWSLYDHLTSRTQIIYGMIAMHPQFLDPANAGYFDFILERRFRSIQRMAFYVNPNDERNVFAYPGTDPPEKMKVNKDAAPNAIDAVWTGARDGTLPFVLTPSGKSDPEKAVEKLFNKNKGKDRNLLACDPVVTVLHMDALRAAKNPDKLLKALAGVGEHYLKIDNPLGHFANYLDGQRLVAVTSGPVNAGSNVEIPLGKVGSILTFSNTQLTDTKLTTNAFLPGSGTLFLIVLGDDKEPVLIGGVNPVTKRIKVGTLKNSYKAGAKLYVTRTISPLYTTLPYHFVTDSRPANALFEQLTVKSEDLQVGDQLYVLNHPLYKIYYPSGAWGGEHSFISEIDTRDSRASGFRTTLKVEGHGLNNTLLGMCNEMLEWNNNVLSILQALTRIHLDYLKTEGRKTTAKVKFIVRKEPRIDLKVIDMNVFEYSLPYTYSFFRGGKIKSFTQTKGFVIKEPVSAPNSAFQVFNFEGTDSIVDATHPHPPVFLMVEFIGSGPAERFKVSKWAVPYLNVQTASFESQPMFEKDDKTPKLLTFDDLVKSKPLLVTDDVGDAYVTRPRVDFGPTYQAFLKSIGAI